MKKIFVACIAVTLLIVCGGIWRKESAYEFAPFKSPNGRYHVRITAYPRLFGHFPGDAGGDSGYVELIDNRTNRVLNRKNTDVAMTIDSVRWEPNEVDIKLFATWPLPE